MVLVVALANDEHHVRAAERAGIDLHLVDAVDKAVELLGGKLVGVDAEREAVDGEIESGLVLAGELVLHLADVVVGQQAGSGLLVG